MNHGHTYAERIIALAGLVQAAHLISTVARSGLVSQSSMEASVASIFVTNPAVTADVYQGVGGISLGLKVTRDLLTRFNLGTHADVLRYVLGLIALERKLAEQPKQLRELGAELSAIRQRWTLDDDSTPTLNDTVIADLARLYELTPGSIHPRIKIYGRQNHLQNPVNVNRIRALLLAGLRAAVLWHQLGGRRWQFLFARTSMNRALSSL